MSEIIQPVAGSRAPASSAICLSAQHLTLYTQWQENFEEPKNAYFKCEGSCSDFTASDALSEGGGIGLPYPKFSNLLLKAGDT